VLRSGYPAALLLTLAVEAPLYAAALRLGWRLAWWRGVAPALLVNALTHPVLWSLLAARPGHGGYPLLLAVAEVGVCVVEWAVLALVLRRDRGALLVVCAGVNAASVLAGLLLLTG